MCPALLLQCLPATKVVQRNSVQNRKSESATNITGQQRQNELERKIHWKNLFALTAAGKSNSLSLFAVESVSTAAAARAFACQSLIGNNYSQENLVSFSALTSFNGNQLKTDGGAEMRRPKPPEIFAFRKPNGERKWTRQSECFCC